MEPSTVIRRRPADYTQAASLCYFLLAAATLHAATVSSDSPNTVVDTLDPVAITVTMHRVKDSNLFENPVPTTGVDEPLRVKAASSSDLAAQPQLPAWDFVGDTGGGLVADGVTPLIFRIVASGSFAAAEYDAAVIRKWNVTHYDLAQPRPKISLPGSAALAETVRVTLSPLNPQAFVVLNAIRSEDLIGSQATGPVVASLEVRDSTGHYSGGMDFGVSRPPVALVHGYNVPDPGWGEAWDEIFRIELGVDRAPGFVIPVGYGQAEDFNTKGSLLDLARELNESLVIQVERPSLHPPELDQWAWTRYDAVGHSQGGVLLRMLCSQETQIGGGTVQQHGFTPWKRERNYQRGRFHRVVTIGSPHAGSAIGEFGIKLRGAGVPYGKVAGNVVDFFKDLDHLFQPKFSIRTTGELAWINTHLQCDSSARLHLLRPTIYDGNAPGEGGEADNPLFYQALYLNRQSPEVNGKRPGLVVAPNGSDGVVDVESQGAGGGSYHTSAITGENIIHADIPYVPDEVPDTKSWTVAQEVTELLAGPS